MTDGERCKSKRHSALEADREVKRIIDRLQRVVAPKYRVAVRKLETKGSGTEKKTEEHYEKSRREGHKQTLDEKKKRQYSPAQIK